jgi:hypothetical protein
MCSLSTYAICCPEHARLEDEYLVARDRLRDFLAGRRNPADIGLRTGARVSRSVAAEKDEERRLADDMAMAIARLKVHLAAHGCER